VQGDYVTVPPQVWTWAGPRVKDCFCSG